MSVQSHVFAAPRRSLAGDCEWWMFAVPLACAGALIVLDKTAIDPTISDWFFDPVARVFPLRHNPFLEVVAHQWAKQLVIILACSVIAMYLLSFALAELKPQRRLLLFLSAALTLAPLAVTLLKLASVRYCPWSLQQYGGFAPHLSLFGTAPPGLAAGHCFPAGHASTGFCLMAFYFAGRALNKPRLAMLGLFGGMIAGLLLGFARVAQGATFASYMLWSGIVCWLVIVLLYLAVIGRENGISAAASGTNTR